MKKRVIGLFMAMCIFIALLPCVHAAQNKGYIFPVPNYTSITQPYSSSHPGIDIGASKDTKIYASKSGTVIKKYTGCNNYSRSAGICETGGVCNPNHGYSTSDKTNGYCNDGFGNGYIIKHDDGTWAEYAHLNSLSNSVSEGGYVSQGTYLGGVGSSGNSTGPHLHFGLRTGNASSFWYATPVSPFNYMDTDDTGSISTPSGTPADIGTGFYTYILNKPAYKPIACVENGTNVVLDTDKWIARQRWYATRNSDGSYTFTNAANNKCLDVDNNGKKDGTNVQVYESNGTDAQKWYVYDNGNSYLIKSKSADKVLDLSNNGTKDGTNVQIYTENGSDAQAFTFYKCEPTAGTPVISKSSENAKTSGSMTLSWDKTDYTEKYEYYLFEYPTGYAYTTYTKHGFTTDTSIKFSNLTSGQYYAFVYAISHKGERGERSAWINFKVYADDYEPARIIISGSHIYALYDYEMSWSFARDLCKELGGNLVTVTSAKEEQVIEELINSGSKAAYWLGASDIDRSDKDFEWVTGEAFSYSNWASGEPSSSGTNGTKEHFAEIRKSYGNKWNDVNNISKTNKGFILEIDTEQYSPTATQTYNGNEYLLFDKNTTWSEADAFCKMLGGHLAYINSEDENEFMKDFLENGQRDWYYLGGQKRNGVWEWSDGSSADMITWADSASSWTGTNLMAYKSAKCVGLNNAYCPKSNLDRMGFVCEIEGEPVSTVAPTTTPNSTAAPTSKPTATPTQTPEDSFKCVKITAEYSDGTLISLKVENLEATQDEIINAERTAKRKVFYWKSLKSMKPVTVSVTSL